MPRTQRRFAGLPALVVAVLALVVALGGTATAASLITSRQIKDNTITTKDVKNGTLLLKDFKRSEAAKLRGKAGVNGKNGASAFAPPPSGTVVKGGGVLTAQVSAGGVALRTFSPLPIVTAAAIDDTMPGQNLFFGATGGFADAAFEDATKCPGTPEAPTATPGNLCIYVTSSGNVTAGSGELYAGADPTDGDAAEHSGFYLLGGSAAAGGLLVRYVWIYRAP